MLDYAVVIMRAQPFHLAHEALIRYSFTLAKKTIVLLGSHLKAFDEKNPWTYEERKELVLSSFLPVNQERLEFGAVRDYPYKDNIWLSEVQNIVSSITEKDESVKPTIGLVGHLKDASSSYLGWFPQWERYEFEGVYNMGATAVRFSYFLEDVDPLQFARKSQTVNEILKSLGAIDWRTAVPKRVQTFLEEFRKTDRFKHLQKEMVFHVNYKAKWEDAPYSVNLTTVDALVEKDGHILVVKRKTHPGKGLYALPGGHLMTNERIIDGALRELREETGIRLPGGGLSIAQQVEGWKQHLAGKEVFDDPSRSLRGRVISHAFYFKLPNGGKMPFVRGGDDASEAFWMPLSEAFRIPNLFFEDHASIIQHFVWK